MSLAYDEATHYHENRAGWFAVLDDKKQRCYPMRALPDVMNNIDASHEVFLSQNEFYAPIRRLTKIANLTGCFVDLDTHKNGFALMPPDNQAEALLLHCREQEIPSPSLINFSGRGLHAKWFYDVPVPSRALPRWNTLQQTLLGKLKEFLPDYAARDATRCLRLVGTVNPKNGETCRTVWQDMRNGSINRYNFDTLATELLQFSRNELQEKHKQAMARKQERKPNPTGNGNLWTPRQLWWNRYLDLQKLGRLRGWEEGVPEGYRGHFMRFAILFAANGASIGAANILPEVQAMAEEYCPTLPKLDVDVLARHYTERLKEKRLPWVKNDTIIEALGITQDEQVKLRWLHDKDMRAEKRKLAQRKNVDRATYLADTESRRQHACRMYELSKDKLTIPQIASRYDVEPRTVKRWLALYRKGRNDNANPPP